MQATPQIAFFHAATSFAATWPELKERIREILDRGKYSHGMMVERFEQAIRDYTGLNYAIAVNSGTDALTLLLRCAGVGAGDEVIVPCFTFVASASSVVHAGAKPVFVDIDPVTYALDPDAVRAAITDKVKAIMPVHLFCQMADMEAIQAIASQHDLLVLEDSAEAIGMRWDGVHAGGLGTAGVLSFFPTKTLGALGDGGMIITNASELARRARLMRHHGRGGRTIDHLPGISHEAEFCGTNSKMDEIQAAVLLVRLRRLEADIERRVRLAHIYDEGLRDLAPRLRTPQLAERKVSVRNVFYTYVIETERKIDLAAYLAIEGIGTEQYYPAPLHLQPCFGFLGYRAGQFPRAEAACTRTLALPFYPDLTDEAATRVIEVIHRFFRQ